MALTRVDTGLQSFPDFSRNQQLANAQIYIGVPGLDPAVLANQYQAYVVQEDGTQVAVAQPIRTSAGGIPTYLGSPVQIAVQESAYSVKVLNFLGSQIYYQPDNTDLAIISAAQMTYTPSGASAATLTQSEWNDQWVTPEGFGAIGDGGADDTTAFLNAIATGKNILGNPLATYRVTANLPFASSVFDGRGCTLLAVGSNQVFTLTSGTVRNVTIDGNGDSHTTYPSEILAGTGAIIENVRYQNFAGTGFQTYPIRVPLFDAFNFTIDNVSFENITNVDNGVISGQGFCGGIYFNSDTLGTENTTSRGNVTRIFGKDIFSVDGGSGVVQDADLIRFFWDVTNGSTAALDWDITLRDIKSINVSHRVIKSTAVNGVSVDGVMCHKNDATGDMYSVISLQGGSSRWTIDNVTGEGEIARGVELLGDDHLLSNVNLRTTSTTVGYGVQFGNSGASATRCIASNITVTNFDAGIYFFDAFDCEVNGFKITQTAGGNGVLTFNNSGGNSNSISNGFLSWANIAIQGGAFLFVNNVQITNYGLISAYPFDLTSGSCRVRNLLISSSSGRRVMNLALQSGNIADLDNVTLVRNAGATGFLVGDFNILSTQNAVVGSTLRAGRIRVVANSNPAGAPASTVGRAHVSLNNVNYSIDILEVENNAARGEYGNDVITVAPQGYCRIGKLITKQPVAGGNVAIANSTANTTINEIEIQNAAASSIAAYVGTIYRRGGATVVGLLNVPVQIVIP